MAMKVAILSVVLMIVASTMVAQTSSAPSPVDCTTVVLSMSDCLSYVTNGSTVNKPEGNCCSGLKSVLKTNAECLCEGFKSSAQFGVVLNNTKALSLPDACHVHAPSKDLCGLSVSPTGAPSQSPAAGGGAAVSPAGDPSASSTASAPSAGMGGSELSPAMSPESASSSTVVGIPVQLIVIGLAAAYISRF